MQNKLLFFSAGFLALAIVIAIAGQSPSADSQLAAARGSRSTCVRGVPIVSVSPAAQSGYQNQTVPYSVSVTNTDSSSCEGSQFWVMAFPEGRPGYQTYGTGGYQYITAGGTAVTTHYIIPPSGTPAGTLRFGYQAQAQAQTADQGYGSNGYSNIVAHTILQLPVDTTAPSVPTSNVVATSGGKILVSWNEASDDVGIAGYVVTTNGQFSARLRADERSYPIGGVGGVYLSPNTTYTVGVAAYDYSGNYSSASSMTATTRSSMDATSPSKATGLVASEVGSTTATFTWNPATDNNYVYKYSVMIATNDQYLAPLCTAYAPQTTCTTDDLAPNTQYTIKVKTMDLDGNSSQSQQIRFTTSS